MGLTHGQDQTRLPLTDIVRAADASGGYTPYVNGSGTQYPAPFVLTAAKAGGNLTTKALKADKQGVIRQAQMWQLVTGILPQ